MRFAPTALALAALTASSLAFAPAPIPQGQGTQGQGDALEFMATDPADDANGLNGQGLQDLGTTATPVQVEGADILSARFTSRYEAREVDGVMTNVLTGIELRTGVTSPATATGPALVHRFMGAIDGCRIWTQLYTGTGGSQPHGTATVRMLGIECGIPDDADLLPGSVTLTGDGITTEFDGTTSEQVLLIDLATAPSQLTERIVPGAYYMLEELAVRYVSPTGTTAPVIDEMAGANGFTIIGDDIPPYEAPPAPGDGGGDGDGDGGTSGNSGTDVAAPSTYECDGSADGTVSTQGADRTGTTSDSLTIGVHAPATGAAPLPTTSYQQAADTYWRWQTESMGCSVLGRDTVEVEFRDDKAAPDRAIQECRELASTSTLLFSIDGTDQTHACSQLAEVERFPYLSTGTTESGMRSNPWYFATTMSHRQQGALLAQYVGTNPDEMPTLGRDATIGTIVVNSPNYDDAVQGWHDGLTDNGLANTTTFRYSRGDSSWYAETARNMRDAGVEVIYFLGSPVDYINFTKSADERFDYQPQYVGPASPMARNAVLAAGCGSSVDANGLHGAIFLSATGGLDAAPAAFFDASSMFGTPADDVALSLWAMAEAQHQLLDAYGDHFGTDLTREDLRAFVEGSGTATAGVHPTASWTPSEHFGGEAMHVVQASCTSRQHVTLHRDARGF